MSAVSGTVTLGGQPLADALVTFTPVASGAPSSAKTDNSGKYELLYARGVKGAEKGDHIVSITTAQSADEDAEPPTAAVPEKVPFAYREGDKQLRATVDAGKNEINFSLDPGPVNPPQAKGKKGVSSRDGCF